MAPLPPCSSAAPPPPLLLLLLTTMCSRGVAPQQQQTGAASSCTMGGCGAHGVCLQGVCTCVDGYTGADCASPPDRCLYPVAVRCSGARSHCVAGECRRPDPCADVSCGEHGHCADGACVCEPGYSGESCSLDACADVACRNGGTCYQPSDVQRGAGPTHASLATEWSGSMLRGEAVCACAAGYAGKQCECMDCGQHGTCQDDGRCTCDPGFVGLRCEIDVNECASSPCQHGGRCVDGAAAYTCACPAGFLGDHCEVDVDECASAPCQNGGGCVNGAGFYACNCTGGWSGGNCTRQPACLSSPCQNGGRCEDRMEVRGPKPSPDGVSLTSVACQCAAGCRANVQLCLQCRVARYGVRAPHLRCGRHPVPLRKRWALRSRKCIFSGRQCWYSSGCCCKPAAAVSSWYVGSGQRGLRLQLYLGVGWCSLHKCAAALQLSLSGRLCCCCMAAGRWMWSTRRVSIATTPFFDEL